MFSDLDLLIAATVVLSLVMLYAVIYCVARHKDPDFWR